MTRKQTLLFIGDSITDGARGRTDDPNHILGHGYVFQIAGKLGLELGADAPLVVNRGISGDRASDLYARWNEDVVNVRPDIVSILVGVNDAYYIVNDHPRGASDRFRRAYGHIIEETKTALPEARIVLCEPFILRAGGVAERWDAWTAKLSDYRQAVRELASEHGAVFVPLQELFDDACLRAPEAHWLWDGIHPTAAGHEMIARQWLKIVDFQPEQ